MAKTKSAGNKSEAIRGYKTANPTAGPKEISAALSKAGQKVTPGFVSTVLSNDKRKGGVTSSKRGRRPAVARSGGVMSGDFIDSLTKAQGFAREMGGIDAAVAALDNLKKVQLD